jgi:hypothetical protein
MITIKIETQIPFDRITDLLCSAFEGGSNYWYNIEYYQKPKNFNNSKDKTGKDIFKHLDYPINEGGYLAISDNNDGQGETEREILNLESIERGLKVMAKKYPSHMKDFLDEQDDAGTGDVFLQCCLFGKVIFG